jgi:tryptophanyl-tRNA synthetase
MANQVILTGVKPSNRPHIGNYFGAMKPMVDLQNDTTTDETNIYVFLADLHALTTVQNGAKLKQFSEDLIIDYLAIGLNPEKVIIFKQSEIPEHTLLNWIFNCITTVPYLSRAHAYKDAVAKSKEANVGLFDYPLLMAADILMYDTDIVPVGQDQKQHVEYARDTAEKFNFIYGETFKLPKPLIVEEIGNLPGNDGRKMSKSYGNHLPLFSTDEEIKKFVMSIKTDSKGIEEPKNPDEDLLFAFHKLLSQDQLPELTKRYQEGSIGYKESKEILIANLIKFIAPLRDKRTLIAADKDKVRQILAAGTTKAREQAQAKMAEVRKKVGLD